MKIYIIMRCENEENDIFYIEKIFSNKLSAENWIKQYIKQFGDIRFPVGLNNTYRDLFEIREYQIED